MDKCREEFEVIARSNGWNLTTYPEITERIDYVNNLTEQAWQMYQHQQAKVEGLQAVALRDKQATYAAGFHDGRHGTPCEYLKLQAERDELQTLYTQQGINMLKLQKRVDAALKKLDKRRDELWSKWKEQADMQDQGAANAFEEAYWILEQALKGENND